MSSKQTGMAVVFLSLPRHPAAGKTSLVNGLLKRDSRLVLCRFHIPRVQARPGEIDGQHYHFVSEADLSRW